DGYKRQVAGGQRESAYEIVPFISGWMAKGIRQVISTDISVDGTLEGPSVDLYRKILAEIPDVHLIASGGVGCIEDIESLDEAGVPAAIVGKALYEGKIPLKYLGERRGNAC
ncbi:MAG: 1-(5-phosphoribosyl)-5-[(5-phosphoribosylamino)methylideneamino]imidazole-4-carboxamide isomerase, partial [Muribaculaceae bacterium]|nr:1-(5-phosphoribosyl)-5-[(5-phosphoribosylamino)methylideneamino]imidazole-4-carboxamide isomerase [Muribaculaceae bacterium]